MSIQHSQKLTDEQIETRRAKDRARYANMTPKQRQAKKGPVQSTSEIAPQHSI